MCCRVAVTFFLIWIASLATLDGLRERVASKGSTAAYSPVVAHTCQQDPHSDVTFFLIHSKADFMWGFEGWKLSVKKSVQNMSLQQLTGIWNGHLIKVIFFFFTV